MNQDDGEIMGRLDFPPFRMLPAAAQGRSKSYQTHGGESGCNNGPKADIHSAPCAYITLGSCTDKDPIK